MSWKKELQDYLTARTKTLKKDYESDVKVGGSGKEVKDRMEEVNNVAAQFGIKIKVCED